MDTDGALETVSKSIEHKNWVCLSRITENEAENAYAIRLRK
jgi:hypothetical protein